MTDEPWGRKIYYQCPGCKGEFTQEAYNDLVEENGHATCTSCGFSAKVPVGFPYKEVVKERIRQPLKKSLRKVTGRYKPTTKEARSGLWNDNGWRKKKAIYRKG
jgi:uncharacterized Zn finger protein